jgi:hypothetical protein
MTLRALIVTSLLLVSCAVLVLEAQAPRSGPGAPVMLEPFKGVTADGAAQQGLFPIKSTGVTTKPVVDAARAFLASLTAEQKKSTTFGVESDEWRRWTNIHRGPRAGLAFGDMTDAQRSRAFSLLQAALSAKGLQLTRSIMKLNHALAEITNNFTEYGEGLYNLVVFGEPQATEPWGWQLEGHHLIVNYFVLGDQVVMTPAFWGSEPVIAETGKYKGVSVLQEEQDKGLALMRSLSSDQRRRALLPPGKKTANAAQAQAYRDNLQLPYAGIRAAELKPAQRDALLDLVALFVSNMDDGHTRVKMDGVRAHLDRTFFAWIGEHEEDSVFYYRVHSPVILIEFDHQTPVAMPGARVPTRQHIHTVVRTPNGNDYGTDLLRQHHKQHAHVADPLGVREDR